MSGDWDTTPQELLDSGWLNLVHDAVAAPGVPHTCMPGSKRLIDYYVVSVSAMRLVQHAGIDWRAPNKSRLTVWLARTLWHL